MLKLTDAASELLTTAARLSLTSGGRAGRAWLEREWAARRMEHSSFESALVGVSQSIFQKHPQAVIEFLEPELSSVVCSPAVLFLAGVAYDRLGHRSRAQDAVKRVVNHPSAAPEHVLQAANLLVRFGDQEIALAAARAAYDTMGRPLKFAASLLYIAQVTADWVLVDQLTSQMREGYRNDEFDTINESPRTHLLWCDDEALNLRVLDLWSRRTLAPPIAPAPKSEPTVGRRLRLGYLSSDFREHPTSRLILGVLRHHDRRQFELFMYCSGWDDGSVLRRQVEAQFDHIHSVAAMSDEAAAAFMRSHNLDVLIELNGPTRAHRMGILSHRPAPVQIDYLGWPGSVGGRVVDYIVGDYQTIPVGAEQHYPEKIIRLYPTYQANDYAEFKRAPKPTRKDVGLPEDPSLKILGMFNSINKVHQEVWDTWMAILRAAPNTLLWVLDPGPQARRAIARAAQIAGVDVSRILASPKLPHDQHLARIQCCDLMLDPWPYGGHTSTADALFAGVPVVAMEGNNFASRVSGSLLRAAGLDALVHRNRESYAQTVLGLLNNPADLARMQTFVREQVTNKNVFNSREKARQLEFAYREAVERSRLGMPCDNISMVQPIIDHTATQESDENNQLAVAIISWAGKHQRALQIAAKFMEATSDVTIVYSDDHEPFKLGAPCNLIRTNNQLFWGDKFFQTVRTLKSKNLLIVHADCDCADWGKLFTACEETFAQNSDVALWAPFVQGTLYSPDIVSMGKLGGLDVVSCVDGIVFGIKSSLTPRLLSLDYSKNIYGWGIDRLIAAHVYSSGQIAVLDRNIVVHHDSGRGYDGIDALRQMEDFMLQMTTQERAVAELIGAQVRYKRMLKRAGRN